MLISCSINKPCVCPDFPLLKVSDPPEFPIALKEESLSCLEMKTKVIFWRYLVYLKSHIEELYHQIILYNEMAIERNAGNILKKDGYIKEEVK